MGQWEQDLHFLLDGVDAATRQLPDSSILLLRTTPMPLLLQQAATAPAPAATTTISMAATATIATAIAGIFQKHRFFFYVRSSA